MEGKILVAYASKYGATAEIAEKIGETLREAGLQVDVTPVDKVGDVSSYNAFIIGSAVYIGLWRKKAVKFIQANEEALADKPVWIFSSGPTGEEEDDAFMDGGNLPKKLKDVAALIKPRGIVIFRGAVDLEKLKGLEKWMIKKAKGSLGDFRDWEAVTSWAKEIAASLR
ncbi:MAG: flavodoxin domain-containing protein [Actinomycetota bacterium]